MGSNLSISGNGTYGDVRFTKFTAETAESAAAESNKVLLKVNSKGGYKFRATNIAFQACKIGTDNGNFDVKWTDAGGTKVLDTDHWTDAMTEKAGMDRDAFLEMMAQEYLLVIEEPSLDEMDETLIPQIFEMPEVVVPAVQG